MANDQNPQDPNAQAVSPAERYKNAEVLDEAPTQTQTQAPAMEAPKMGTPAERYANYDVVSDEDAYEGNLADATAQAITQNAIDRAPERAAERNAGEKAIDWVASAGRGTLFGPLADPIGALIISHKFKEQGITYSNALDVVRANNKATKSLTGSLVGAFLGGGIVASGLKKGASYAATKSGMARGAMQWSAKNKKLNRIVSAAGVGAAAGAVEEGIRTGLEETIDATGGHGFDSERIVDNVLLGTLIGGAATPALQEGMNGAKWLFHHMKKIGGGGDAQTYEATKRIMKELQRDGDTMDETASKFRERVQDFRIRNGRVPAAAEIMAPEQVANVAEVSRVYNGLDMRARKLGKEGVERSLRQYDEIVTGGKNIESPEFIENQMEELFTDVMKRNGDTMVDVDDEALVYLGRNIDFIKNMATNGNEGAARMAHVLESQKNIASLRTQHRTLMDSKNNADAHENLSSMRKDLQIMLRDAHESGGADSSDIAELRSLIQLQGAIDNMAKSGRNAYAASFNLEDFKPLLNRAQMELDNYAKNGLKIRLGDANNIRSTASRHFNIARHQDADKADAARRVRDAVAPIGKAEVPEYANVVKRWNLEMNRGEAQATGIKAARGDIDLMDLETRITTGRLPNKPKPGNEAQRGAVRQGIEEGTRRQIQNEVRGTTMEGVRSAQRLDSSPNAQKAVGMSLGKLSGKEVVRVAKQVADTYDSMKALAKPSSVSELAEERQMAQEVLTGAAFGNLGGAGRAALLNKVITRFTIPRGTAKKMIEMLGNPKEVDKALSFMQKKGVRVGPLFAAVLSHLTEPSPNGQ